LGKGKAETPRPDVTHSGLMKALSDCGIVEMEGTGRPVADILSTLYKTNGPQTLVVRCVFDDPWLAADYVLLKERLQAVVEGSFVIAGTNDRIRRILFAVSRRERKLGQELLDAASALAGKSGFNIPFSMVLTGSRYPQKNSRELTLVLRNYEKKEGVNLGTLLTMGPATLAAVYDAFFHGLPILERYVAVGGSAVRNPQVMRVRLGKRIRDLFEECGGFTGIPDRIATGSPVSGETVTELDEPVTKNCYAVFAMLETQTGDYPERDCISCGECRAVCPVGLDPEELYKRKISDPSASSEARECHGCGCCEVVCPSHLPLADIITGKMAEPALAEPAVTEAQSALY
jgi:electron transport complex protein RnfC